MQFSASMIIKDPSTKLAPPISPQIKQNLREEPTIQVSTCNKKVNQGLIKAAKTGKGLISAAKSGKGLISAAKLTVPEPE